MATGRIPINGTAAIQSTIVDAKGDLIAGTGADAVSRLAVGANGTTLVADSSEATGLKWATPSSGSMTLLSTTTLSGSATTVSSINQTYTDLIIEVYGATWNTGDDSCAFSTNLTSVLGSNKLAVSSVSTPDNLSTTIFALDDSSQNQKRTGGNNYFRFTFNNYASTTDYKVWSLRASYEGASSNGRMINIFGGVASDTAIDSFTFKTGNGYTLTAGTLKVYGVK